MTWLDTLRESHRELAMALASGGEDPDPAYLALLIARRHCPDLEVPPYLARLDALADRALRKLGPSRDPDSVIAAINTVLFDEEGFYGNVEDYYNPSNSFLHEVMDRRSGIPITLSIIYLAVARRMEQPFFGVGLPLHFLVKYSREGRDILIDPFNRGKTLSRQDCEELLCRLLGTKAPLQDSYLESLPARHVLYRMLNNLKLIFLREKQFARAGVITEQMLLVRSLPEDIRDRGLLFLQEGRVEEGRICLARYLEEAPDAADADRVRDQLLLAYDRRAQRN